MFVVARWYVLPQLYRLLLHWRRHDEWFQRGLFSYNAWRAERELGKGEEAEGERKTIQWYQWECLVCVKKRTCQANGKCDFSRACISIYEVTKASSSSIRYSSAGLSSTVASFIVVNCPVCAENDPAVTVFARVVCQDEAYLIRRKAWWSDHSSMKKSLERMDR